MEQQTIPMGQAVYELQRVFQGTRPLSELMAERLARHISTRSDEAGSPGRRLPQNIPAARSVDGGGGHEI